MEKCHPMTLRGRGRLRFLLHTEVSGGRRHCFTSIRDFAMSTTTLRTYCPTPTKLTANGGRKIAWSSFRQAILLLTIKIRHCAEWQMHDLWRERGHFA